MASTYLDKTLSTPTNNKIYTFSAWVKRSGTEYNVMLNAGSSRDCFRFRGDNDRLHFFTNEATTGGLATNRVFRDKNAFYHLVLAVDTTQATASDRVKIYVNGVQETSFAVTNYPAQNYTNVINSAVNHRIGKASNVYDEYFDGIMSHIHFIDGTAYAASAFGEYDANGVWKAKTSPSVTYGNNGFFILKDSASVTDQSGNGNNFTVGGGTLTDTLDCSANVFCTWNPLTNMNASATFSNGNNTVFFNNTNERHILATLGMNSGKFYWESKLVSHSGDSLAKVGIESSLHNDAGGYAVDSYGYRGEGGGSGDPSSGRKVNNGTFTNWGSSYTAGDIIGCAVDLDNNKIYFSKNGTWQESGDPTSGATGTGSAFDLIAPVSGFYHPSIGKEASSTATWSMNFGNGYFGTTAVASAGTNASGIGIFEYDVPTGYTALSTKGLNL